MNPLTTAEARERFAEVINRAAFGHERVVLTRHGKALVAVVPIEDIELLEALEDQLDLEEARSSLQDAEEHGTVSWDSIKDRLGLT
jgi:prevent-host-death family protein